MKKTLISLLLAASALAAPLSAQAAFLVQQWQGGGAGGSGFAGADAAIASRPADASAMWSVIDFTDDPGGFAGDIPGSNPWPLATLLGQSGTGASANTDFAALITGTVSVATSSSYTFRTYADDGVRLKVDGTTVISDNSYHPEIALTGSIFLTAGTHSIDLLFFEWGGEASLEFSFAETGGGFTHVTSVPEPGSLALLSLASLALAGVGLRRRRQAD